MNRMLFLVALMISVLVNLHPNLSAQSFMGDVNGDGKINLLDFVKVVNHIQGTEFLTDKSHILQADVNGDGLINSYDLEESMKYRFNH